MIKANGNFNDLQGSYLFSEIAKRVEAWRRESGRQDLIFLGIGDVTRPLAPAVIEAIHRATDEMAERASFRGYGPEQGYDFLRQAIVDNDYKARGVDLATDEIFVSDGSKCDTGNIGDILAADMKVAVTDPVYPVYVDTNVMAGRAGVYDRNTGRYDGLVYIVTDESNGFVPGTAEGGCRRRLSVLSE